MAHLLGSLVKGTPLLASDNHLVNVSIDFGTHSSGPGWCEHDSDDDPMMRKIRTFDQWPGQPVPSVKTLTALLLDRNGEVLGWGYEARRLWTENRADRKDRGWRYHHGFKMSLARTECDDASYKSMALDDKEDDPEDLITKYLRCMFKHTLGELQASGYEESDIRWCLTVPAIWNEHQKAMMRNCARRAGFPADDGRVILAYEPEAAAQHARLANVMVTEVDGEARDVLNVAGRLFIVADCGGGTVDMTSYKIANDGSLIEMGSISGEARGAMYVNKAIEEQVLVPRLGGPVWYSRLQERCPEGVEELHAAWERAKINIGIDHSRSIYLPISSALAKQIPPRFKRSLAAVQHGVDDHIVITPAEAAHAFDSAVNRICVLVDEQLQSLAAEKPSGAGPVVVLLVGGFAASPYLRERLAVHLDGRATIRVPPEPQVAVLAGAVHFACRPDTRARRARRTYGVTMLNDFEEGVDPESKRVRGRAGQIDRCDDRFEVLITKGELVPTDKEVSTSGIPFWGEQPRMQIEFFSTRDIAPRYTDDPECDYLGSVEVDLTPVMHLPLEQRSIRIYMKFGETEIHSRVVLNATNQNHPHSFDLFTS